ncbi:MAG TPA: hypothetical protein VLC52_08960 [Anaerolineae bacterium]|nr:hypothetical protein [Anaerolineae bacterium]
MNKLCQVATAVLLLALQVACAGPTPTTVPQSESTPAGPLNVILSIDAVPGTAGNIEIAFTLENHGQQQVYLPICGPWEIYRVEDPERPSWFLACEIDYLGHRVQAGDNWRDRLVVKLEPGTYHARTQVYGDCTLGPPHEYSPREVNYGDFGDCAVRQEVVSLPFEVQ